MITQTATDWVYAHGGTQRRLETRWKAPVKPGDVITPSAVVTACKQTEGGQWFTLDVSVHNQRGEVVAAGEAMVEVPLAH